MTEFDPGNPDTWPPLIPGPDIWSDRKKGRRGIIPGSRSHWLKGVKAGIYPAPVHLGPKLTAWRANDLKQVVKHGSKRRRAQKLPQEATAAAAT